MKRALLILAVAVASGLILWLMHHTTVRNKTWQDEFMPPYGDNSNASESEHRSVNTSGYRANSNSGIRVRRNRLI